MAFTENTPSSPAFPEEPPPPDYPVRFSVDYPEAPHDRASVLFRWIYMIPILILAWVLRAGVGGGINLGGNRAFAPGTTTRGVDPFAGLTSALRSMEASGLLVPVVIVIAVLLLVTLVYFSGVVQALDGGALFVPVLLMLLIRRKYPLWWFEWNRELARFTARIGVYGALLRDEYPSTDEEQAVHFEIDPPDGAQLNPAMPLIKWFLATPHYYMLGLVGMGATFVTLFSWFAILFTGRQPRGFFDLKVAQMQWGKQVAGYATMLVTDRYPPFGLRLAPGITLVTMLIGLALAVLYGAVFVWFALWLAGLLLHRV